MTDVGEWFVAEGEHDRAAREPFDGAAGMARHLLAHGLVDELRFWLPPAVWGRGTRPYEGQTLRLRLLDSTAYDSGVALLRYEPAGRRGGD